MNVRKTLESRIRGWLPKDPALPSKSTQPQIPNENKPVPKRKLSKPFLVSYFVLLSVYLYLSFSEPSTLAFILIGITVAIGLLWIGIRRFSHNIVVKLFKYALIGVLLFVLIFSSFGVYLSNFAGPTVPQINYSNILDISLSHYLQTLEQSTSFSFIQAEHVGTITFEDLSINSIYSNAPGGLEWTFHVGDLKCRMLIGQSGGKPYSYDVISYMHSALPQYYPSNQEITNSFEQIDSLGLHWFYNQAVGEYQNATGGKPITDVLTLEVGFDSVSNYQGITLIVTAEKAGQDNFGNKIYNGVFEAEFQPNGTMLSFKNHPFL